MDTMSSKVGKSSWWLHGVRSGDGTLPLVQEEQITGLHHFSIHVNRVDRDILVCADHAIMA